MKKNFIILIVMLVSLGGFSQTQKELNKSFKDAKDDVSSEYVILKSGERKDIKSIEFTTEENLTRGKVEFVDGSKLKLSSGDEITACYTNEATYKLCSYFTNVAYPGIGFGMSRTFIGKSLAARLTKGAINVYILKIRYQYNEKGTLLFTYARVRFFEGNNDGNLIEIKNDTTYWNKAAALVGKSKNAMGVINELRKRYGKLGSTEEKILEAIDLYNKDAAAGKLEN